MHTNQISYTSNIFCNLKRQSSSMRALRYYGIQDIRLDDIPEPDCRPGCVKIKPEYVGICGSDM